MLEVRLHKSDFFQTFAVVPSIYIYIMLKCSNVVASHSGGRISIRRSYDLIVVKKWCDLSFGIEFYSC